MNTKPPFERTDVIDKPGIIGAKWWHATLVDQSAKVARRNAMKTILIAGGVLAGFGAVLAMCVKASTDGDAPDATEQRKTSLDVQKDYGWSFGSYDEPLVFDGATTKPFEPAALALLGSSLQPARTDLRPYYLSTLFDAPYAAPKAIAQVSPEQVALYKPLAEAVKPTASPAMETAYLRGKSMASVFAALAEDGGSARDAKTALVVDLPGAEAVAFAAGAASVFDPVFLFDNWPHPRGVVRSQQALSAAAYYQPLFQREGSKNAATKPPMFVLDRTRLTPYTDEASQFDNRYIAKLPSPAAAMSSLGVSRVLYVVPTMAEATRELDDLNDDFLLYENAGLDVKAVGLDLFGRSGPAPVAKPQPSDTLLAEASYTYYGGSPGTHHSFFLDYPWVKPPRVSTARAIVNPGKSYQPTPRQTPYSTGSASGTVAKPRPPTFGTVPLLIAVGTGAVLGARYSRNGSWNRSSGSGWAS